MNIHSDLTNAIDDLIRLRLQQKQERDFNKWQKLDHEADDLKTSIDQQLSERKHEGMVLV